MQITEHFHQSGKCWYRVQLEDGGPTHMLQFDASNEPSVEEVFAEMQRYLDIEGEM
jgi:hypothetical protein